MDGGLRGGFLTRQAKKVQLSRIKLQNGACFRADFLVERLATPQGTIANFAC